MMTVSKDDVEAISDLVHSLCGVHLHAPSPSLLERRLGSLAQSARCDTLEELAQRARGDDGLCNRIVDKITVGETSFFRDQSLFDALQHKILPNIIDAKEGTAQENQIRVWSVGCSTGQEPCSVAIVICELLQDLADWDVSILATDVSQQAVSDARRGVFSDYHVERGLPSHLRREYFQQVQEGWQINDRIASLVDFQHASVLDSRDSQAQFDLILCRNVAIYFKPQNRGMLFDGLADSLSDYGYLLVGSAEVPSDPCGRYYAEDHCGATLYRPVSDTVYAP